MPAVYLDLNLGDVRGSNADRRHLRVIVCDTSLGACEVVRDAYQLCVLRE